MAESRIFTFLRNAHWLQDAAIRVLARLTLQLGHSIDRVAMRIGRRIDGRAEWHLVKGFLAATPAPDAPKPAVESVAVAMFDLDLGEPTDLALEYVGPKLQEGSVLIFDKMVMFKGHGDRGEAGAFARFCEAHPELHFRRFLDYGNGGRAHILAGIDG